METGLCLTLFDQGALIILSTKYQLSPKYLNILLKMEALILQSLLGRESGRKKPSTGNAINNAQQRNFHLPCRGQRAIFSPPAVRLRNQTTPTGRPNKDRQEVPDKYLHQRSVADRLIYPFSSLDIDSELVNWRLLQGASNCRCGELKIGLCYESTLSTLRVFVVEARNLPYADFGISSKPYVRLWLVQFGNCLDRRKTRPKSRSHSPIFREQFIFTVPLAKLPIVKLVLAVCMDPPIGLDDEVGHIILERQSKGAESRHWEMMIQNQDETLEMWHKLKKEWC
ncbi:Synaptotagmin-1 [Trichinella sp. T9]|nr:Synaptotagmin-1 [Trichinella sp. T9]